MHRLLGPERLVIPMCMLQLLPVRAQEQHYLGLVSCESHAFALSLYCTHVHRPPEILPFICSIAHQ